MPQPELPSSQTQPGSQWTGSEAPVWHGANAWHILDPALDGSGVKVGVIDTSFNNFLNVQRIAQRVLTATATPYVAKCTFGVGSSPCYDAAPGPRSGHGAWVTEAVLDIAPEAEIFVARTAANGESLRTATQWMIEQNVHIINASLRYDFDSGTPGEPDNMSSILKTVELATQHGIVWVNAAGNDADEKRNYFLLLPEGTAAQTPYWDNDWLRLTDSGLFFINALIVQTPLSSDGEPFEAKFRMRWGHVDDDSPASLKLFVCDNNGCTGVRRIADDDEFGARIKIGKWPADPDGDTDVFLRVCRDPDGGYPSWVQIGASGLAEFKTASSMDRTIEGVSESNSNGMLAVGAADASESSNGGVVYELASSSGRGPTADGRTKPDIVGVHMEPSTLVATAFAQGTTVPVGYSDGRWKGTSQAAPHVAG